MGPKKTVLRLRKPSAGSRRRLQPTIPRTGMRNPRVAEYKIRMFEDLLRLKRVDSKTWEFLKTQQRVPVSTVVEKARQFFLGKISREEFVGAVIGKRPSKNHKKVLGRIKRLPKGFFAPALFDFLARQGSTISEHEWIQAIIERAANNPHASVRELAPQLKGEYREALYYLELAYKQEYREKKFRKNVDILLGELQEIKTAAKQLATGM